MTSFQRQTLTSALPKVRGRIQQVRRRKESIGEQNTKAVLIEPLLSALGWDLEDLDEVLREYRRKPQDNPVDYALFILRTPRLFVEAKALDTDLTDRKWISQTLGYATVVGVEWCVLTDGDEYRIYNAHAPVDVEEKLFRVVRVSDSAKEKYMVDTLELLSKDKMGENLLNVLWKAHSVDRHVKAALDDLLQGEDSSIIRLIRKRMSGLRPSEIRESLKRADIRIDFPMITTPPPSSSETVSRKKPKKRTGLTAYGVKMIDLIEAGLITPPLELETTYRKVQVSATVQQDGKVVYNREAYDSLSTAAGEARSSVRGDFFARKRPQTNGWTFWKYRDTETGKLEEIDHLRQQYLQTRRSDSG